MKPLIAGKSLGAWLLRILMIWYVYVNYFGTFTAFEMKVLVFYIAAVYVIFSLLLFIGAFLKKQTVTVVSGLILFLVAVIQVIRMFPENPEIQSLRELIPAVLGFYFLTHGNTD